MALAQIVVLLVAGWTPPEDIDAYESALAAALHHFAREGEVEHVKAILEKHPRLVDATEPSRPGHKPYGTERSTPLHWAARRGHATVASYLMSRGAAINADRGCGWTPLHDAAQGGHLEIVKLLVARGANVDAKTEAIPETSSDRLPGAPAIDPAAPPERPKIYPAIPARTALELAIAEKQTTVVTYLKSLKRGAPR
jgi:ankyrin repeat protein